jgi:hypothetical protein
MIERLPRGQFPVNAVIGREGKRELLRRPLGPIDSQKKVPGL